MLRKKIGSLALAVASLGVLAAPAMADDYRDHLRHERHEYQERLRKDERRMREAREREMRDAARLRATNPYYRNGGAYNPYNRNNGYYDRFGVFHPYR